MKMSGAFSPAHKIVSLLFCFFIPSLALSQGNKNPAGVDEATFNFVIHSVTNYFKPVLLGQGDNLHVETFWKSSVINAFARRLDSDVTLAFHGGLARLPGMDMATLALITCHEVGHLLGGAPFKDPKNFISAEAQADYFATSKCMRQIVKAIPEFTNLIPAIAPSASIQTKCFASFSSDLDQRICWLSASASKNMLDALDKATSHTPHPIDFESPDPTVVTKTNSSYPSAQCRLDTLIAGDLCQIDEHQLPDRTDENIGVCSSRNGDVIGLRPRCWFQDSSTFSG